MGSRFGHHRSGLSCEEVDAHLTKQAAEIQGLRDAVFEMSRAMEEIRALVEPYTHRDVGTVPQ